MSKTQPSEHFKSVYTNSKNAARSHSGKSRKQKLQLINGIYAEIDSFIVTLESQPKLAQPQCKIGCNLCCYLKVDVTELEAANIVHHLKTNLSYKQFQTLKQQVRSTAEQTINLDNNARVAAKIPCPLLSPNGKCSVYAVRPLGCRSHASVDFSQCESGFGDPKAGVPLEAWRSLTCSAALLGLMEGLREDLQELNVRLAAIL